MKRRFAAALVLFGVGAAGCRSASGLAAKSPSEGTLDEAAAMVAQGGPAGAAQSGRQKIDIVFTLDTTGSMGGLLAGAKEKIWEIARHAQQARPAPEVRIGLVAYRDVGDEYVTKVYPLTTDLDLIYASLTELQASGGGDTPEHVLKGLSDSVNEMAWTQDPRAVKLIYLVGDAPPHFDYQDGITLPGILRAAEQKAIRISGIRCGNDEETLAAFTRIARPTDGEVATIEQTGGVVAASATPYDDELARLNAELAATEIHYGSADEQRTAHDVVERNLAAPKAAQADRASFYSARAAGKVSGATKKDLAADPSALGGLKDADLPAAMKKMSPAERAAFVEAQRQKREAVLAKVKAASASREKFLSAAKPAAAAPPAKAFDRKVYDAMERAGAEKGMAF